MSIPSEVSLCWLPCMRGKILAGDFWNHAAGKLPKTSLGQGIAWCVISPQITYERHDGGHHAQAIVRFRDRQPARNACAIAAGEHQRRVCRNAEERSVIATGVESAHVKIPMIVRHN